MGIFWRALFGSAFAAAVVAALPMVPGVAGAQEDGGLQLVPAALTLAPPIGAVRSGTAAFGMPVNLNRRTLGRADEVFVDEIVETLAGGALHILLVDETEFRLGEESRMTLDELVYDPASGKGSLVVRLGRGVFRIASGAIPRQSFRIVTPVATIGIRGTVFEVRVGDHGATTVSVFEGAVDIEPNFDAGPAAVRTVIAATGQSATVAADGSNPVLGRARPSDDPGLRETESEDGDDGAQQTERPAERAERDAERGAERLLRRTQREEVRTQRRPRGGQRRLERDGAALAADGDDGHGGGGNDTDSGNEGPDNGGHGGGDTGGGDTGGNEGPDNGGHGGDTGGGNGGAANDGNDGKDGHGGNDSHGGKDGQDSHGGKDGQDSHGGNDGKDGHGGKDGKDGKDGHGGKDGKDGGGNEGGDGR